MPLTPQITLTATLMDFSGVQLGSVGSPAYLRIALCGFGQILPGIAGTAMIGKVTSWPGDIPYTGTALSVKLWGNDVITPGNTYYAISVLDANKNVIQSGAYQLTGTQTIDLSAAMPFIPVVVVPSTPTVVAAAVVVPYSSNPVFNAAFVAAGIISFEITLTGNVTLPTLINVSPGQIITFMLIQNSTGGWTFSWPSGVNNATIINAAPNSKTVQTFVVCSDGQLYPQSGGTYN